MARNGETLFGELRRQEILQLLQRDGRVAVLALCEHFSVSPATIRNDLTELEHKGLLRRTHGGAIGVGASAGFELTTREKEVKNVERKQAIAAIAVQYVRENDVIAIDTGTTTLEFARLLADIPNLTIISNDLGVVSMLEQTSNHTVILLGGTVRRHFRCTTGNTVLETLSGLHIDKAFIATNGINAERGLSTPNMEIASIKQRMIEISSEIILLADSSKIGHDSFVFFSPLERINTLITDDQASDSFIERAESKGVRVHLAAT